MKKGMHLVRLFFMYFTLKFLSWSKIIDIERTPSDTLIS
jgi:hypothetical protein